MKAKQFSIIKLLPFIIVTLIGVPIVGMAFNEAAQLVGYKTVPVEVVGTGSMYPSLYWSTSEGGPEDESTKVVEEYRTTPLLYRNFQGISILGKTYLKRNLGYGDMVAFNNEKTREILSKDNKDPTNGFIKRVIALAGDTVELRDGFVYLNNVALQEPYIATPRSTYGGTTLQECKKILVPEGSLFVLGDNRKVSSDSRFDLGLISINDISFILPYAKQQIYYALYRDTSKDAELLGQPTLSSSEFVKLVNEERKKLKLKPLKESAALNNSSSIRGSNLLKDENTLVSMQQSMTQAGYSNIVLGEFVSRGRFTAKELVDNLLYQAGSTKQILSQEYDDLGIKAVTGEVDSCPTQIIVGQLGGYVPAVYDDSTIKNWVELRDNLKEVIPTWARAQGYNTVDQGKLSKLLSILRGRATLADEIIAVMNQKNWLTKSQEDRIKQDEINANMAEALAKELNKE
jgi:signal peptidase I